MTTTRSTATMIEPKEIRIGDEFQALVPNTRIRAPSPESEQSSKSTECQQVWKPNIMEDHDIDHFLDMNCRYSEMELGLECLFSAKFNPKEAAERLRTQRQIRTLQSEVLSTAAFATAFRKDVRDWRRIQTKVGNISIKQILAKYYKWKVSPEYQAWKLEYKGPSSSKSSSARSSPSSMDQHAHDCQICNLPGELLCCDTCTNAYHLGCLTPPLEQVPLDSWNCPDCTEEEWRNIVRMNERKARKKAALQKAEENPAETSPSLKTGEELEGEDNHPRRTEPRDDSSDDFEMLYSVGPENVPSAKKRKILPKAPTSITKPRRAKRSKSRKSRTKRSEVQSSSKSSNTNEVQGEEDDDDDDEEYEVEEVVGRRTIIGSDGQPVIQYLLKWVGYDDPEWENYDYLNCQELVDRFHTERRGGL